MRMSVVHGQSRDKRPFALGGGLGARVPDFATMRRPVSAFVGDGPGKGSGFWLQGSWFGRTDLHNSCDGSLLRVIVRKHFLPQKCFCFKLRSLGHVHKLGSMMQLFTLSSLGKPWIPVCCSSFGRFE